MGPLPAPSNHTADSDQLVRRLETANSAQGCLLLFRSLDAMMFMGVWVSKCVCVCMCGELLYY